MKKHAPTRTGNPFTSGHPKRLKTWIWSKIRGFLMAARSFFIGVLAFIYPFFISIQCVSAADLPYRASVSSASATLQAGESKQITLKFTNTGSQTWVGSASKTAVYLYGS